MKINFRRHENKAKQIHIEIDGAHPIDSYWFCLAAAAGGSRDIGITISLPGINSRRGEADSADVDTDNRLFA